MIVLAEWVGVSLLFAGMLQELFGNAASDDALRHEIVALVAQHTDDLRGECLVEYFHHELAVQCVGLGDRAFFDVLARAGAQRGNVLTSLRNGFSSLVLLLLGDVGAMETSTLGWGHFDAVPFDGSSDGLE